MHKSIRRCLSFLRIAFGPELGKPVKFRRVRGLAAKKQMYAYCSEGPKCYHIAVDHRVCEDHPQLANVLLCHEIAHALDKSGSSYAHGEEWGKQYARVWRCWLLEGVDEPIDGRG